MNQLIESDIKYMQLNLPISFGQCEACIKYYSWTERSDIVLKIAKIKV